MSSRQLPGLNRGILAAKLLKYSEDAYAKILEDCGKGFNLTCINCGHRHDVQEFCKKRWCPDCAPRLSAQRLARMRHGAEKFEWPLFVTLTMRNVQQAQGCFKDLGKAFSRFRKTKFWKHTVKGGMSSMEVTNRGNGWHPHLHCLLDCCWLSMDTPQPQRGDPQHVVAYKCNQAQKELSVRWGQCIGQSTAVVYVKRTTIEVLPEVLKYSIKPGDLEKMQGNPGDVIRAMERTRMIRTFGSLYGLSKEWEEMEKAEGDGVPCEECGLTGHFMPTEIADRMIQRDDPVKGAYPDFLRPDYKGPST
jgi:Replication protein